jgi:hypothetical protein
MDTKPLRFAAEPHPRSRYREHLVATLRFRVLVRPLKIVAASSVQLLAATAMLASLLDRLRREKVREVTGEIVRPSERQTRADASVAEPERPAGAKVTEAAVVADVLEEMPAEDDRTDAEPSVVAAAADTGLAELGATIVEPADRRATVEASPAELEPEPVATPVGAAAEAATAAAPEAPLAVGAAEETPPQDEPKEAEPSVAADMTNITLVLPPPPAEEKTAVPAEQDATAKPAPPPRDAPEPSVAAGALEHATVDSRSSPAEVVEPMDSEARTVVPPGRPEPTLPRVPEPAASAPLEDATKAATARAARAEEICQIGFWRGYLKGSFYARTFEPDGEPVAVAESRLFRPQGNGIPERANKAAEAFETLVAELKREGWEPIDNAPDPWYAQTFRRSLKGAAEPVRE